MVLTPAVALLTEEISSPTPNLVSNVSEASLVMLFLRSLDVTSPSGYLRAYVFVGCGLSLVLSLSS